MAQRTEIVLTCDVCTSEGRREVPATTYVVTAPPVIPTAREIELCDKHAAKFLAPITEVLAALSRRPRPARHGRQSRSHSSAPPEDHRAAAVA